MARANEMTRRMSHGWLLPLAASLMLGTGCGVTESDDGALATQGQQLIAGCATTGADADADGLDDGLEDCLLQRHAPVVYMPIDYDWTLPTNVDWYLARTVMRFSHDGCSDCAILAKGAITQSNVASQTHNEKNWLCSHTSTAQHSYGGTWNSSEFFFLQTPNDTNEQATHSGSSNPADWKVYGHAYKNSLGGVNLQYWFFYAYNDSVSLMNHEADWEHVNVRLDANYAANGVYYAEHGGGTLYTVADVQWFNTTHPIVWSADGSHASFRSENECDTDWHEQGFDTDSCETNSNYRWFTWAGGKGTLAGYQGGGVINVGEKTAPRNGQTFIKYNSRWGEVGNTEDTSGPRGPAFQSRWTWDV